MDLTWALLGGAILLIALLMLALFWQELRVRYWQEALADMGRRLHELQTANDALRRENRRLQEAGRYLARPAGSADQALR